MQISNKKISNHRSNQSLAKATTQASVAVMIGQIVSFIVRYVGLVALARLLDPESFGVAALGIYIAGGVAQIRLLGIQQFLIRTDNFERSITGTANVINLALAISSFFVLFFLSTWIAGMAEANDSSVRIVQLAAIYVAFVGVEIYPKVKLMRDMKFHVISIINSLFFTLCPYLVSVVVALFVYRGPEIAFLPFLLGAVFVPIVMYARDREFPIAFSGSVFRDIIGFGLPLGIATLLSMLLARSEIFLLTQRWGAEAVGFYVMASQLVRLPGERLFSMLGDVFNTSFSQLRNDPSRLGNAFIRILTVLTFVCGGGLVVLANTSRESILLFYGSAYEPSAVLLNILASGFFVQFPSFLSGPLLVSLGRTRLIAIVNVVLGSIQVSVLLFMTRYGLEETCISLIVLGMLNSVVWIIVLRGVIRLRVASLGMNLSRVLIVLAIAYFVSRCTVKFLPIADNLSGYVFHIICASVIVCGCMLIFFRFLDNSTRKFFSEILFENRFVRK